MGTPRLLVVFFLATAGVVLLVLTFTSGSWWLLIPVVIAHGLAVAIATGAVFAAPLQQTKPDPVTEARLEEEEGGGGDGPDDDEPRMAI
jgi:hypothetical protein